MMTTRDRIGGIDPGVLVAYADGVLPPEQAREVEAALYGNPDAEKALSLMRQSAVAVRHAFDDPLGEPVPERLRSVFDEPTVRHAPLSRRLLPVAASIVALLIGLGIGYLAGRSAETGLTIRLAGGPADSVSTAFDAALLQALAGSQPSVEYSDTARGTTGTITLLATVETSFGVACREFRHVVRDGQQAVTTESGLACQRADGGWEVTILVPAQS